MITDILIAIVLFLSIGYASVSHSCDMENAVYPEVVETPTVEFRL